MYREVIVAPHQRAVVKKNGQLIRWLEPGLHRLWFAGPRVQVEHFDLDLGYAPWTPELQAILPEGAAELLDVTAEQLALLRCDGLPAHCLLPGRYLIWQLRRQVQVQLHDTGALRSEIPAAFQPLVPRSHLQVLRVKPHERCLVYVDGQLADQLEEGVHALNALDRQLRFELADLREQELQITGQEVMTGDKVSLRVNLIVKFRVTDPVASTHAVADLRDALYSEAQLIARRTVAGAKVDELLERRVEAAGAMSQELAQRAQGWGVEVLALDLKDVVLPGEMKLILNQVIEAEKRAAANVIARREETAATRSLANTARMLQSSPVLMRLKELEAMKEMAENVGQITLVASPAELLGKISLGEG